MAFNKEYILSIDEFDDRYIKNRDELANILFDEYLIDYTFVNNAKKLKVFINNEDEFIKLKKMIRKYSNNKEYAKEIENTNESIKNIIYNKMENRRFRNVARRHTSLRERMNERSERSNRFRSLASKRREIDESFENRISRRLKRVEESNKPMRFSRNVQESRFTRPLRKIDERNERLSLRRRGSVMNESLLEKLRRNRKINESEERKKCPTTYDGKKIEKMSKSEKRSAVSQVKKDIKEAQKLLKQRQKDGRATKAIEAKIEKLQCLLDCLTKKEEVKESLRSKFARNRRIFEADEVEDSDDTKDNEEVDDEDSTDNTEDNSNDDSSEDEFDDVDIKAITLKVLNKNVDKLKDALIEAGVEENDIEVTDNEDADEEDEVGIKVDVNSFDALKSYCDSVGIDLEEELGGDVVSDDDTEEESNDDEEEVSTDTENDTEDDDFTDAELDDIFK